MIQLAKFKKEWVLLFSIFISVPALAAGSVSRGDITWKFSSEAESGVYANGDPWVVGPVVIQQITPGAVSSGGASLNGSMINPSIGSTHGLDSRLNFNKYNDSLNVGKQLPLALKAGDTMLSSVSKYDSAQNNAAQLEQVQILTVVSVRPKAGEFRPPYIGRIGNTKWNKNNLDYSVLRSLPKPSGGVNVPDLQGLEKQFNYPWIIKSDTWTNRSFRPSLNHPSGNYGREVAHLAASAVLSLQLDYSIQDKEKLLVSLVQAGIDIYGAARYGNASWHADGGHNAGNKLPLLLAGAVLADPAILNYANKANAYIFQEDQQTFYVDQAAVNLTNSSSWKPDSRDIANGKTEPYSSSDIGLPEWGIRHKNQPQADNKNWNAIYRHVISPTFIGHALAAQMMGLEGRWNWKPFFEYSDRYYNRQKSASSNSANAIQLFVRDMWENYRYNKPTGGIELNEDSPPLPPKNLKLSQDSSTG